MNSEEYIKNVLMLKSPHNDCNAVPTDLKHAVYGMVTEAAELMDVIKRASFYGKGAAALDYNNIREELGDQLWYIALAAYHCGTTIEQLMDANIAKLKARYPDKFTTESAYNRDYKAEYDAAFLPNGYDN